MSDTSTDTAEAVRSCIVYWVDRSGGQWTPRAASVTAYLADGSYELVSVYSDAAHTGAIRTDSALMTAVREVVNTAAAVLLMPEATYAALPATDQRWLVWLLGKYGRCLHTIPSRRKADVPCTVEN